MFLIHLYLTHQRGLFCKPKPLLMSTFELIFVWHWLDFASAIVEA